MKGVLSLIFSIAFFTSFSQLTTEYYNQDKELTTPEGSYFFVVGKKNKQHYFYDSVKTYYSKTKTLRSVEIRDQYGNPIGYYASWYRNGRLLMKGRYEKKHFKLFQTSPDSTELAIGLCNDSTGKAQVTNYNGFIDTRIDGMRIKGKILNGLRDSVWTQYDKAGRVLFHESWHEGELIDGISFDTAGKEFYYKAILTLPAPVVGINAFYESIGEQLGYPKEAAKRGIEGKIIVNFVVEQDGVLTSPKIVHGLGFGCDEEVMRVIALSKPWMPAIERGQPVRHEATITVLFKLK